ncbi:MAG: cellulose synthase complex periplasmic endoglucanase BcsZ [Thioalkalivibrionaceae bacterium]
MTRFDTGIAAVSSRRAFLRRLGKAAKAGIIASPTLTLLHGCASKRCRSGPQFCREDWLALWSAYKTAFVSADGRVIDHAAESITTSEGQSYAMFFALVVDDRELFDRLLQWTQRNLADGDLTATLPAWKWGQRGGEGWGVIDSNSASDSDLWIAYDLIEAGRLWQQPGYSALGRSLARRVVKECGFKAHDRFFLLPAAHGFGPDDAGRVTLNPSYSPIFLLDRLHSETQDQAWLDLIDSAIETLDARRETGFAPDWIDWQADEGFLTAAQGSAGSYDAIRTYLWWGLTHPARRSAVGLDEALAGMARHLDHNLYPPRLADSETGATTGTAPPGFSAALIPYLAARGREQAQATQLERVFATLDRQTSLLGSEPFYYDQNLALFGLSEQVFSFSRSGELIHT